jgi:hypothetical protein
LEVIYWFWSRLPGTGPEPGLIVKTRTRPKLDQNIYILRTRPGTGFPIPFVCGIGSVLKNNLQPELQVLHKSQEPPNTGYKLQPLGVIERS